VLEPSAPRLEILADPAGACAGLLIATAASGGELVLAGGRTPGPAYAQAAREPAAWSRARVWFGDERCVSPKDVRSNYRMVHSALLAKLDPSSWPEVLRIRAELGLDHAVHDYERQLRDAVPPRFDLVLLGVGTDGHTASLFPDQETLNERERLVVGVERPGLPPFVPRVTLTLPALTSAKRVVFLVTGAEKAGVVAAAFGPAARPDPHVPASMVADAADEVLVLLDAAAASRL
jgi:6-phosphogluconolactonase